MKTDYRTQYTKKTIRESFISLLKEMPLNRVTVKGICEKAHINRTTFYRYYSDAYDLLEKVEVELFAGWKDYVRSFSAQGTEAALEAALCAIGNNAEFYTILISDNADRQYIRKIVENSYEFFQEGFAYRYPRLSARQRKWLYYYITQGCISIVLDWVNGGMKESPKSLARFIAQLDETILKNAMVDPS